MPSGVPRTYRRGTFSDDRLWRVVAPKWSVSPNSTMGAAYHGGRWNRAGCAALYLSEVFSEVCQSPQRRRSSIRLMA
ncbi:RES domain-containing protein [Acidisphaera sp. S103]|uniref:RES domain-containing protein n=1 Tax=Acidisphaera sp. S103 TaxID=1747223 RepID=UPI00352CE35E